MGSSTPYQLAANDDLRGVMIVGQIFAFICLVAIVITFGGVYVNTQWTYEYTRFSSGPPSPGQFFNRRFTITWLLLAIPALNVFSVFILLMIMSNPLRRTWSRPYYWITLIMIVVTAVIAVSMFFIWCGFFGLIGGRNHAGAIGNLASDDRGCCVFHASNVLECTNSPVDCPLNPEVGAFPVVLQSDLGTNPIFWWHWAIMGWFILSGFGHFGMMGSFKEFVNRAEFVTD